MVFIYLFLNLIDLETRRQKIGNQVTLVESNKLIPLNLSSCKSVEGSISISFFNFTH